MSKPTITDSQIRALRAEAVAAGDTKQIEACDRALLLGDKAARATCAAAIRAAAAMVDG